MEDQTGTVLHWSNQKEPKQAKSKDEVIRRNLDRIRVSTATPLPSNSSRHSKPRFKKLNNYSCQNMSPIKLKFKTCIPNHYEIIIVKFHVD